MSAFLNLALKSFIIIINLNTIKLNLKACVDTKKNQVTPGIFCGIPLKSIA